MSAIKKLLDNKRSGGKQRRYGSAAVQRAAVSWVQVRSEDIMELIEAASEASGAVRFGLSRDGGALALGVYGDGDEGYTLYAPTADGMLDHIAGLVDVFNTIRLENAANNK